MLVVRLDVRTPSHPTLSVCLLPADRVSFIYLTKQLRRITAHRPTLFGLKRCWGNKQDEIREREWCMHIGVNIQLAWHQARPGRAPEYSRRCFIRPPPATEKGHVVRFCRIRFAGFWFETSFRSKSGKSENWQNWTDMSSFIFWGKAVVRALSGSSGSFLFSRFIWLRCQIHRLYIKQILKSSIIVFWEGGKEGSQYEGGRGVKFIHSIHSLIYEGYHAERGWMGLTKMWRGRILANLFIRCDIDGWPWPFRSGTHWWSMCGQIRWNCFRIDVERDVGV
jgi:hypothetical protein